MIRNNSVNHPTGFFLEKLHTPAEYQEVYQHGQKSGDALLNVFILSRDTSGVRYGITATRRIGNAVTRNRIKRVLRECIRRIFPRVERTCDIVLIAKKPLGDLKVPEVLFHVEKILTRAGVIGIKTGKDRL